jgi:hypothetical protein
MRGTPWRSLPAHWSLFAAALVAPVVGATSLLAVVVVAEMSGRSLLSVGTPRNVAEAAGMANAGELLRRIDLGEDPGRIYDVRPEIISSAFTHISALEAAVGTRRVELVRLLDGRGLITGATRVHLACLASDIHVKDIVEALAPGGASCTDGSTLETLAARTRG